MFYENMKLSNKERLFLTSVVAILLLVLNKFSLGGIILSILIFLFGLFIYWLSNSMNEDIHAVRMEEAKYLRDLRMKEAEEKQRAYNEPDDN